MINQLKINEAMVTYDYEPPQPGDAECGPSPSYIAIHEVIGDQGDLINDIERVCLEHEEMSSE